MEEEGNPGVVPRPALPKAWPAVAVVASTIVVAGVLIAMAIVTPPRPAHETSQQPLALTSQAPRPRQGTSQQPVPPAQALLRRESAARREAERPPPGPAAPSIPPPPPSESPLTSRVSPPVASIRGKVFAANAVSTPDFVAMDIGRDEGVSPGMRFEVVRRSQRIAVVQVEVVKPTFCAARIVERTAVSIQKGDSVRLVTGPR